MLGKHAPAYMKRSHTSTITLTSGSVGVRPVPGWVVPASYAGGLISMTKALALELKPIRVNLVQPGAVDTNLWSHLEAATREKLFKKWESEILTGRVGQPEDVAEAYAYCWRDGNVTGATVQTDGGHTMVNISRD